MSDFNCDFNAPQFFDFNELVEGEEKDNSSVEAYFAFDHENEVPVDLDEDEKRANEESQEVATPAPMNLKEEPTNLETPSSSSSSSSGLLAQIMRRQETPKGRKEIVEKAIVSAQNSPQPELPRQSPRKNVGTLNDPNVKNSTGLGVNKRSLVQKVSSSPAVSRWKKAVKMMTPELFKQVKAARKAQQQQNNLEPREGANKNTVSASHKEVGDRLAHSGTMASKARETETQAGRKNKFVVTTKPGDGMENYRVKVTKPVPFKFATERVQKKQHHCKTQEPVKATAKNIDITKMLKKYESNQGSSGQASTLTNPTVASKARRRSNSFSGMRELKSVRGRSATPEFARSKASKDVAPFSFVQRDLKRIKEKAEATKNNSEDKIDFLKTLRRYPSKESVPNHGPTRMEPFHFHERPRRVRSSSAEPDPNRLSKKEEERSIFKAKPVPHYGVPIILQNVERKPTTAIQAFSFEARDQMMSKKREERLQALLEKEKAEREFRANPMPDLNKAPSLPKREAPSCTEPKPFKLQIEERVEARVEKWQKEIEEEMKRQREAARFHAHPARVLEQQPFVPAKVERPLTEVSNLELHSDKRAKDREAYEKYKKQREAEHESMKRQLEERRRQEEEMEVKRLRREAVHKAEPIRHYPPVVIEHSKKPLTQPVSPKFSHLNHTRKSHD